MEFRERGEVRWGILGCGSVTERKSGPAFQKVKGSRLVAVMRRTAHLAEDYARRHGVPRWYSCAEDLIADSKVDAIYIATPPDTHCKYTLMCAEAGKPVYVEKPMARTFGECLQMIRACREYGVPLFVAYYRRALPRFLKVKEWLNKGAVGNVRFVRVSLFRPPFPEDFRREQLPWRTLPEIAGGGYFMDLASHTLDLLDFLLGPIDEATGKADNLAGLYPAEDTVSACWRHENGVIGSGIWCFCAQGELDEVRIEGDGGQIVFSTFADRPVQLSTQGKEEVRQIPHPYPIQQPLIEKIVGALLGEEESPSTGETAARTSRVMDQILAEYRRKFGITFS